MAATAVEAWNGGRRPIRHGEGRPGGTHEHLKAHFRELVDPKIADPFRGGRGQIDRKTQPLML
jgi:hypothetical protein